MQTARKEGLTAMTTAETMHAARLFLKLLQVPLLDVMRCLVAFASIDKPCFRYFVVKEAF
jgi:hypothetical protein